MEQLRVYSGTSGKPGEYITQNKSADHSMGEVYPCQNMERFDPFVIMPEGQIWIRTPLTFLHRGMENGTLCFGG